MMRQIYKLRQLVRLWKTRSQKDASDINPMQVFKMLQVAGFGKSQATPSSNRHVARLAQAVVQIPSVALGRVKTVFALNPLSFASLKGDRVPPPLAAMG
jgi:hypothetical protein